MPNKWGVARVQRPPGSVTISLVITSHVSISHFSAAYLAAELLLSRLRHLFPNAALGDVSLSKMTFHPIIGRGATRSSANSAFLLTLPSEEMVLAAVDMSGSLFTYLPPATSGLTAAQVAAQLQAARAAASSPGFVYPAPGGDLPRAARRLCPVSSQSALRGGCPSARQPD
uniref:Uncharacterized protein n=1 Tax=Chlamydomonas leiostraca TaxID=1034604 RepID=A0A7S0NBM8_9CHLO